MSPKKYEYKFIRLGKGWPWATSEADSYEKVIEKYAREGWKQLQIFAPSRGIWGLANFHEVILEREVSKQRKYKSGWNLLNQNLLTRK